MKNKIDNDVTVIYLALAAIVLTWVLGAAGIAGAIWLAIREMN